MRVIIAGSREIDDYKILLNAIKDSGYEITEVVSGGCRGPDKLGERWAVEHSIPVKHFYAQWKKYGRSAGPIRNIEMSKYAEAAIFLWDGKSRGTEHCINACCDTEMRVFIYRIPMDNNG